MKTKITILLFTLCLLISLLYSCTISKKDSLNYSQKELNNSGTEILADVTPFFTTLRFKNIGDKTIEGINTISAYAFEEWLKYLKDNEYHFLCAEEAYNFINYKIPVPEKSVWLTFDESMESAYTIATPMLEKYNARATLFVGIEWIREPYRLTNRQLAAMSKSKVWDIQSHGYMGNLSFPINSKGDEGNFYLNKLWIIDRLETDSEYKNRIKKDIQDSFDYLESNFDSSKFMFAYPFTESLSNQNNKDTVNLLLQCLDELKIIGIAVKEQNSIFSDSTTPKHFISRYSVDEFTIPESLLSLRYSGKKVQYTNSKGKTIKFNNIIKLNDNRYFCWDKFCNFIFVDKYFNPISEVYNFSHLFKTEYNGITPKSYNTIITSMSDNLLAIADCNNGTLIYTTLNGFIRMRYKLNFTPISMWKKDDLLYILDNNGNVYKFETYPKFIYTIDSDSKTFFQACYFQDTLNIIDDFNKQIYIINDNQSYLKISKSYLDKYSLVPQFCINKNEFIAWENNNEVFVKVKIK